MTRWRTCAAMACSLPLAVGVALGEGPIPVEIRGEPGKARGCAPANPTAQGFRWTTPTATR